MRSKSRLEELDRAFHSALAEVVKTRFPNPERKECPPAPTLQSLARKTLPISDPAIEHVARCSPCFNELQELRVGLRRRRILWSSAAAAAVVVLAVLLGYSVWQSPVPAPIDATPEVVVLDLRPLSPVRGETPTIGRPTDALVLPRRVLDLTIQFPVASAAGPYELEIRQDGLPLVTATADAVIENGITTMRVDIDTRPVGQGEYDLAVRPTGLTWRLYALTIE